jgi:hypothetical protein
MLTLELQELVDRLSRTEYDDLDACKAADIIKKQAELITKFRTIVQHAKAETTGVYFVCGDGGEKDEVGLPEMIMVCPAFGLDGFAMYKKASEYSAPSY